MRPICIPTVISHDVECSRSTSRSKYGFERVGCGTFSVCKDGYSSVGIFKSGGTVYFKAEIPSPANLHNQVQADRDGDPTIHWQAFNMEFEACGRKVKGFKEGRKYVACRMYRFRFKSLQALTIALD